ncbi:MAG TPA: SDR family NAD(P)-dependent oxidoreductase [Thermoanaerobaculia bacterium]|nr:SDR family NAD(P)-dependent oxidoreductase [Thermoanaerobaculia bacterium]
MIRLHETVEVPRPIGEAFAYASDFANIEQWDPGVSGSVRLKDEPVGPGSRFRLDVDFGPFTTPMVYVVTLFEAPHRVVLEGQGDRIRAVDDIRFEGIPGGTRIDYTADLTFLGPSSLAEPFLRSALEGVGRRAVEGLKNALSREPKVPKASLVTTAIDHLVLPGLLRFTRLGYRLRKGSFAPLAVSLRGRTAVVTGATSGLGRAAAAGLARLGARVVLVGRDPRKAERAREEIRAATGNADLAVEVADLSLLSEVRALARRLLAKEKALHILVNNAGILENERRTTPEGLEVSLVTNLLAPYVLTRRLRTRLLASAPARVVNVVSGGMYLAGLGPAVFGGAEGAWDGTLAYARHKRALTVLTELWSDELFPHGVVVHAMHPGWAETPGVVRSLPAFHRLTRPFLRNAEEGADTIVWLAAAPEVALSSGGLWLDRERHPAAVLPGTAGSAEERKRFVEELERMTGEPSRAPRASRTSPKARTGSRHASRRRAAASGVLA